MGSARAHVYEPPPDRTMKYAVFETQNPATRDNSGAQYALSPFIIAFSSRPRIVQYKPRKNVVSIFKTVFVGFHSSMIRSLRHTDKVTRYGCVGRKYVVRPLAVYYELLYCRPTWTHKKERKLKTHNTI